MLSCFANITQVITDVLGTEAVQLDNSKNQLTLSIKKKNLTIKLQMEEFYSDS